MRTIVRVTSLAGAPATSIVSPVRTASSMTRVASCWSSTAIAVVCAPASLPCSSSDRSDDESRRREPGSRASTVALSSARTLTMLGDALNGPLSESCGGQRSTSTSTTHDTNRAATIAAIAPAASHTSPPASPTSRRTPPTR